MTNSPGTSSLNNPKGIPIDTDPSVRSIVIGQTAARGLGGAPQSDQRRYHEIFDDAPNTGVGSDPGYRPMGLGRAFDDHQPPFPPRPFFGSDSEGQSFFIFYHQKGQGVKIVIQAGTRTFFIVLALIIVLLTSPGIRDALDTVIKALTNILH